MDLTIIYGELFSTCVIEFFTEQHSNTKLKHTVHNELHEIGLWLMQTKT